MGKSEYFNGILYSDRDILKCNSDNIIHIHRHAWIGMFQNVHEACTLPCTWCLRACMVLNGKPDDTYRFRLKSDYLVIPNNMLKCTCQLNYPFIYAFHKWMECALYHLHIIIIVYLLRTLRAIFMQDLQYYYCCKMI